MAADSTNEKNAVNIISTDAEVFTSSAIDAAGKAYEDVSASIECFCLSAGIEALSGHDGA